MLFRPSVLSLALWAAFSAQAAIAAPERSPVEYYRITEKGVFRLYRVQGPAVIEVLPPKVSIKEPASSSTLVEGVQAVDILDTQPEGLVVSEPVDYFLDVTLNGVDTKLLVNFKQTVKDHWLVSEEDLVQLGLLSLNVSGSPAHNWIDLHDVPGVSTRYDEESQRLYIQAQNNALAVKVYDARDTGNYRRHRGAESGLVVDNARDFGAFINHTLYYSTGGERWQGVRRYQSVSGLFEGNLYGAFGNFSSTQLLSANRIGLGANGRKFRSVRLDTQWSWFDEERLLTLSAGDFVGSSLSWSRSARLGGFQLRRNFSIRPDLVTMPLLGDMSGSAAVPSTVELYINNARRFTQDVAPGPFAITNLPLITGAGTARMVVRDALGRETVSETAFYASNKLLAKGLADFAVEGGFARRNYGLLSQDYDSRFLASVTGRYGLSNAATLEGVAQGGGGLALMGLGSVVRLGTFGVAGVSGAFSRYGAEGQGAETGSTIALSLETRLAGFSLNARHQRTFGKFNDLASITASRAGESTPLLRLRSRPARSMSQLSLSLPQYSLGSWSAPSVNLSYTPIVQAGGSRSRLAGVNLGQRLPYNGWLSVSAYRDLERSNSTTVFAMFSWFLGDRLNASSSVSKSKGSRARTTVELSRSEQAQYGSVGWRLRSAQGLNQSQAATASYRTRVGRFEAGVEHMQTSRQVNSRLQMDGAIVFAGGGAFLTNRIYDSFGVVNVGAPDVEVKYENNLVGKTNDAGKILLTGLRAYERNKISIDPMNLPADADIPVIERFAVPRYRSGVTVDFKVALQTRSALVTIRDEQGKVLPVGSEVKLNDVADFVVGYDGQVWLEDIAQQNQLVISQPNKPDCVVNFEAPETMTERLVISDAVCNGEANPLGITLTQGL